MSLPPVHRLGCWSLTGQGTTTQDCVWGLQGDFIFCPDSSFCLIPQTWVNTSIFGRSATASCSDGRSGTGGAKLGMLRREKGSCSCSSSPWLLCVTNTLVLWLMPPRAGGCCGNGSGMLWGCVPSLPPLLLCHTFTCLGQAPLVMEGI